MNVFARPVRDMPEPLTRRVRWVFFSLFLIGGLLRCYASFTTLAMLHPDEHQQFMEQAQRHVYGYGHLWWEQERGIRHPFYPALLAVPLTVFENVGIRDSMVQGILLRWSVSLLALLAWTLFAWEFHRRGDTLAALLTMCVFALEPDIIYVHIHPLSETAATISFLLALVLMERRPFWSGVLLACCFAIRFQMGFIVGPTVILAWLKNGGRFNGPFWRLTFGFGLAMFGLCLADKMVHGGWLHSPVWYYRLNVVEGVSNHWGVEPWYAYFIWLGVGGWGAIVPLALLVLVGVRREWPLMLLSIAFVVPHLLVAHKEARFLLPVAPLMLALAAVGFSEIARAFAVRFRKRVFVLALVGLAILSVIRLPQILWNVDPYRPTATLLHAAGRRPDLAGIIVFGCDRSECANYFYLRRNVPLIVVTIPSVEALERDGKNVNYLMCKTENADLFAAYQPVKIAESGRFTLYRLDAPLLH